MPRPTSPLESANLFQQLQFASSVRRIVYHLGEVEAATGSAPRRRVSPVLPKFNALYEIHFVVDRYDALVAVLSVVLGKFLKGVRTVFRLAENVVTATSAAARRPQLPINGSGDQCESEESADEHADSCVLCHPSRGSKLSLVTFL